MSERTRKSDSSRTNGRGAQFSSTPTAREGLGVGVLALVFGIGGLLMSWIPVGAVLGVIGIGIGILAMVKAVAAKRRAQSAGDDAALSGSFGLGIVAIVMGAAAVVVSLILHWSVEDAMTKCDKFERTSSEYSRCISTEMGTDKPK